MTKIISKLGIAIALGTVALSGVASAAPLNEGPRTVAINVKGIDLNTIEGSNHLDRLTRAAARKVCNVGMDNDLGAIMAANKCFKRAVIDARTQVAQLRGGSQVALLSVR